MALTMALPNEKPEGSVHVSQETTFKSLINSLNKQSIRSPAPAYKFMERLEEIPEVSLPHTMFGKKADHATTSKGISF